MQKWRMIACAEGKVEGYLKDGWEPFAVTTERDTQFVAINYKHIVWLRKKV